MAVKDYQERLAFQLPEPDDPTRTDRLRAAGIRLARYPGRQLRREPLKQRPAALAFLLRLLRWPA